MASVQTDDGRFDELAAGLRSVPERLRAPPPPPPPPSHDDDDERVEVIEPPVRARAPSPSAIAIAAASRPKSARSHRLRLASVDTGAEGTTPALPTQGAVGQRRKLVEESAPKTRSGAKLRLQQDTLGLGQQRGPSSDDAFAYEGGSKTATKWDDVQALFKAGQPLPQAPQPPSAPYVVKYVVPQEKNQWQQSKGGRERPRVLRNFRAFDAADDMKLFKDADEHAVYVASQRDAYADLRHLLWALSGDNKIIDEFERVRVLYTWFLCVDLFKLHAFPAGDPLNESVNSCINEFAHANYIRGETIARLFEMFCHYLNIDCRTLSGFARGGESATGRRMRYGLVAHSWNAVFVHNQWRLLDVAWGYEKLAVKEAVPTDASTDASTRLQQAYEQLAFFYFLPNSEHFACDHWCDEPAWQMLEAPISREQLEQRFEQRAELAAGYFAFGFEGVPALPRVIDVQDAEYELSLKLAAPPPGSGSNKPRHQAYVFRAKLERESGLDWSGGLPLSHYVALYRSQSELTCVLRPPVNGEYVFTLRASRRIAPTSATPATTAATTAAPKFVESDVARFRLRVSGVDKCPRPFPARGTDEQSEYGPQKLAVENALWTSAGGSIGRAVASNGVVSLKLAGPRLPKKIIPRLIRLGADGENEHLDHLTEYWVLAESVGANAHLPAAGEYLLELVCKDPATPWRKDELLWRQLVVAAQASPLALVLNEDIEAGARPIESDRGSAPFRVDKPEQSLRFDYDEPFAICKYQLSFHSEDAARPVELLNHYAIYQSQDDNKAVTFNLRFPKKGMYSLLVHSKTEKELQDDKTNSANPSPTYAKLPPAIRGCLFQYEPQEGATPRPAYPLGQNAMGALGLSAWGRDRLLLTDATKQHGVLKLPNGSYTAELTSKYALNVWAKMWRRSAERDALDDVSNCVLVRTIDNQQQTSAPVYSYNLAVHTPAAGEYVLALYGDTLKNTPNASTWDTFYDAEEKKQFDASTTCLLWRLVLESAGEAKHAAAIARLPLHVFGPSPAAAQLGANLRASQSDPHQKPKEEKMELTFTVDIASGLDRPSVQLDFVDAEGSRRELGLQGWTLLTYTKEPSQCKASVRVRFERAGFYVLSLLDVPATTTPAATDGGAAPAASDSKSRLLYSFLLEYEAAAGEHKSAVKFPRQRRDWEAGYEVFEPLRGELRAEDYTSGWVVFSLRLPQVTQAAVFVERQCFELEPAPGGELVGEFFLGEYFQKGGKALHVAAVLPTNAPNAYTPLLTYQIV